MSEIAVQGLMKQFDRQRVVDNVSFSVKEGEFFVLLGPSGSGKTTILRMISGLEQPDSGTIWINQQDVTRQPTHLRNVGFVFQNLGLYPHMDVFSNIAYSLQLRKTDPKKIEMRVVTAADTLGVRSLLKRSVEDLSGGERQRILLARALVKDADIYLFDEPLSNLDPQMRLQARQEMMLVHRIKQKPTVYVTHDQAEALAIAHRVAIIVKGQKLQEGTPDEIYHRPKNLFIAQLVGTPQINILDAQIFHTDTRYSVLGDGIYFTLPPHWNSILNTSRLTNIKLGIRPNSIIPEWDFNTLNPTSYIPTYAQITQVITRINDTVVSLRLGSTTELLALFETKKDLFLEVGQIVNIGIHREQIFLFDSKTEELLNPPDKP